jgi:hypothetical protein
MNTKPAATKSKHIVRELTDDERSVLEDACADPQLQCEPNLDSLALAMKEIATQVSNSLPSLVSTLQVLVNEDSSPGLVVLEELPTVPDPRQLGLLIGWLLGDVTKYENEGDYLIEIKDQGTKPGERPSFRNSREFFLHTDLSYVPEPPRFFLLHSIANDAAGGGYSEFCHISKALDAMHNNDIKQLLEPYFEFPSPPHFKGGGVVLHEILSRTSDALPFRVRYRRDSLRTINREGIDAVVNLVQAFRDNMFEMTLQPNSIAVIDNWFLLHGRTAFAPQPAPRHINRIYVNPRREPSP